MTRLRLLVLALTFAVGCECSTVSPDAGPDASTGDAPSSDAPFVCVAPDVCPTGCNWTPCGCATDNPAIDCRGGQ